MQDCNVTESEKNAEEPGKRQKSRNRDAGRIRQKSMRSSSRQEIIQELILKFRMDVISSALIVSFRMPVEGSAAVPWKMCLDEVRTLAETDIRKVVLTGIHLSSYGIDFDKEYHLWR